MVGKVEGVQLGENVYSVRCQTRLAQQYMMSAIIVLLCSAACPLCAVLVCATALGLPSSLTELSLVAVPATP